MSLAAPLAKALSELECRGVANSERVAGELLLSIVAPVVSKYDHNRETRDIGPGILVADLRAAVKSPAENKRDAKLAYINAQTKYMKWVGELYDWPEGWVIRACYQVEKQGKALSAAAIKKELPPSPLDVEQNGAVA